MVEIGVVGKPHGIRGGVNIYLHNEDSNLANYLDKLLLQTSKGSSPLAIESIRPTPRGFIVFLQNVKHRDQANELKGAKLVVRREDLPEPDQGEFYVEDLVGLNAFDGEKKIGVVVSSIAQADIEVITIENESEQVDVPLVDDFVIRIDFEENEIALRRVDELPHSKKRNRK